MVRSTGQSIIDRSGWGAYCRIDSTSYWSTALLWSNCGSCLI